MGSDGKGNDTGAGWVLTCSFQLKLSADSQSRRKQMQKFFPGIIQPRAFSQCCSQSPLSSLHSQGGFPSLLSLFRATLELGEAPALLPTPLCCLHTRLVVVWAALGLQSSESNPGSKREEARIGCKNFGAVSIDVEHALCPKEHKEWFSFCAIKNA